MHVSYMRALTNAGSTDINITGWQDQINDNPPTVPPRPTSQRAATMVVEPSEQDIEQFIAVSTYGSRDDAIKFLKARKNNLGQALNSFFEGEDVDKDLEATAWDEGAWGADRDGNQNLHPLGTSPTPTRGPSPAPNIKRPGTQAEEDAELQAALAASQSDMPYSQELGVMPASGRENQLKPAVGNYDLAQWALVPATASSSSEIVPDASIEQRSCQPGEPRFIKQLPGGEYLSALLTICHSIPLAREALLMRDHVRPNYGEDGEWWKGHPVAMPKIVSLADGSVVDEDEHTSEELVMEVQRLMAFLDASDRSYASVNALVQTDAIKRAGRQAALKSFLGSWEVAASHQYTPQEHPSTTIFRTVVRQAHVDDTEDDDAELTTDPPDLLNVLDIPVNIPEGAKRDLSQELDNLLWGTDGESSATKNSCIESAADVIVIHAYQQDPRLNKDLRLEVPSELFVDKYMDDNFKETVDLRRKLGFGRDRIRKIDLIESKLVAWQHPTKGRQLDAGLVLKHALGHYNGEHIRAAEKKAQENGQLNGTSGENLSTPAHYSKIAAKLDDVINSIDQKLERLAIEKEKTRRVLAEVSKQSIAAPQERYTLRGISTKQNVTYLLSSAASAPAPSPDGDIEVDRVEGDTTPEGMQWWRIEYEPNATGARVTKTKMPDYDVLRAAELEHSSALLVYASDRAVDTELLTRTVTGSNIGLPGPLQDFIAKDNRLFEAEKADAIHELGPSIPFSLADDYDSSRRRGSQDSTLVNADYDSDNTDLGQQHYGMSYEAKPGYRANEDVSRREEGNQTPVHEIHLDDQPQGSDMEMVEKAHPPLIPGLEVGKIGPEQFQSQSMSDIDMSDDINQGDSSSKNDVAGQEK
ncbi:hypothetical protein K431DRAFT_285667 [Polychaeton citri CBS 116435]|uniref:UBA domain-containing protein n=1 Tax=Polychaeton citri CBS 116435 TaxID=1314669 RepID=A0A9P4UP95_9PEZI|nr:hypothetical protein K431DRAFT_285667 [Polychaeton citri CBS 116435]